MARRSSFDFAHTCPKIDNAINNCKNTLESYLIGYINEISPLIPDSEVSKIAKTWSEEMYNGISDCFESVRETNEDMRSEANRQIENLEGELYDAKEDLKELSRQLDCQ